MFEQKEAQGKTRDTMGGTDTLQEELKVTGENLLKTIRQVIHEGNFRRIIIRNEEGHTLLELPLSVGLVGALLLPVWAAVSAMAAVASGFTIVVERPAIVVGEKTGAGTIVSD